MKFKLYCDGARNKETLDDVGYYELRVFVFCEKMHMTFDLHERNTTGSKRKNDVGEDEEERFVEHSHHMMMCPLAQKVGTRK
jgi:hypothetical protein